ncbi:MAG TPA: hypothetical protein ENG74_02245, partial [Thermoplasmatales archaeon]|nr:hypothetical protein [Thermoplasmatales archaeon]
SDVVPFESVHGGRVLGSSLLFELMCRYMPSIHSLKMMSVDVSKGLMYGYILPISPDHGVILHPTAFAGWVGLLVTAVNLFPAGQLDGGHIARAILKEKQRYLGWFSVIFLLFTGWWFFSLLVVMVIGVAHPPPLNDLSDIDTKRKLLFVVGIIMLIMCFVPFPIYPIE